MLCDVIKAGLMPALLQLSAISMYIDKRIKESVVTIVDGAVCSDFHVFTVSIAYLAAGRMSVSSGQKSEVLGVHRCSVKKLSYFGCISFEKTMFWPHVKINRFLANKEATDI